MKKLKVLPDPDALAGETTALFFRIAIQAVQETGRFSVALAGGSTPEATYQKIVETVKTSGSQRIPNETQKNDREATNKKEAIPLSMGKPPSRPQATPIQENWDLDWTKVHFFWGDERCVPPDHPDSNYHMAWNALLNHLPVPYENLHRMEGEIDPGLGAKRYQDELENFFGSQPNFDLVLLGMGTDGHTASLFPGTSAVTNMESWVVSNYVPSMNTWRLTLTPGIINHARNVIFIISGESKAGVLRRVFKGKYNPSLFPSQIINPVEGNLFWFVDKAAAKLLTQPPDPSI